MSRSARVQPAAVARCTSRHLEKCAAAQAETEARLAEYRKAKGTDVDNEALHADEIRAARDEYTQLMRFGDMRAATEALQAVRQYCTWTTELGGGALLEARCRRCCCCCCCC